MQSRGRGVSRGADGGSVLSPRLCSGAAAICHKRGGLLCAGLIFLFLSIASGHWVRTGPALLPPSEVCGPGLLLLTSILLGRAKGGWGQAPSEFELPALVSAKGILSQAGFPLPSTVQETVVSTRAGGTNRADSHSHDDPQPKPSAAHAGFMLMFWGCCLIAICIKK